MRRADRLRDRFVGRVKRDEPAEHSTTDSAPVVERTSSAEPSVDRKKARGKHRSDQASPVGTSADLLFDLHNALTTWGLSLAGRPGKLEASTIVTPAGLAARIAGKPAVRDIERALAKLAATGEIVSLSGGRWALGPRSGEVIGTLKRSQSDRIWVQFDRPAMRFDQEIKSGDVAPTDVGRALVGDRVRAQLIWHRRDPGGRCVVSEVLERPTNLLVGVWHPKPGGGGRVVPHGLRAQGRDLVVSPSGVPAGDRDAAMNRGGQWVSVRVKQFSAWPDPLDCEIVEWLGDPAQDHVDVTILLRSFGCRETFPDEAIAEAEALPDTIDWSGRIDWRKVPTVTMDGADAKDFDDAISIARIEENRWMLGVHIADVAHAVKEGGALDIEAQDRATSIYPLDRVVPMLPPRLSEYICSLRPREEKHTISCWMLIDSAGHILGTVLGESVIESWHRFTYDEAQHWLDADPAGGPTPPAGFPLAPELWTLLAESRRLTNHLIEMKRRRGALDLDVPERRLVLDERGRTQSIGTRQRALSHRMIEEFMTICNEAVARALRQLGLPGMYRIHEAPEIEAVERLIPVLRGLGIPISLKGEFGSTQLQAILATVADRPAGHLIRRLLLRSMKKAVYHEDNLGHFGLGSESYLHFTSPIRRYPDLVVHRILASALKANGGTIALGSPVPGVDAKRPTQELSDAARAQRERWEDVLPALSRHCSSREREAMQIEYDAAEMKTIEYMTQHVGEEFDGVVGGVSGGGLFIELNDPPAQGFIHIGALGGRWDYDEEAQILIQNNTGRRFRLTDPVRVLVEKADPLAGRLGLRLIEGGRPVGPGRDETGPDGWFKRKTSKKKSSRPRIPKRKR